MKKLLIAFLIPTMAICLSACTDNYRARHLGGTETITLKPHQRLMNVTWKSDGDSAPSLWLLVEDSTSHTFQFKEKSALGIVEGTILIKQP